MNVLKSALIVALVAGLAACGSGRPASDSPIAAGLKQIKLIFSAKKAQRAGGGSLEEQAAAKLQDFVAKADGAVIIGVVEELKIPVVLQPQTSNGAYVTWYSPDSRTMTMLNGVVTATRGFGGDILTYDALQSAPFITGRKAGSYVRVLRFLGPQYELRKGTLNCVSENKGSEEVAIIDTKRNLVHMSEACTDQGGGTVTSDYWVDGSGLIWQSRQWLGPQLGFVFFQRVKA